MRLKAKVPLYLAVALLIPAAAPRAQAQSAEELRVQLEKLDVSVLRDRPPEELSQMLEKHAQEGLAAANRRSSLEWRQISGREQWEAFKRKRLEALRASLGQFPEIPGDPRRLITRTLPGDGFVIEDLVFESRPGLWVTANLYRPDPGVDAGSFATNTIPKRKANCRIWE
jgi:hypothetical protein